MLEASLEKLDLKIAQSRRPSTQPSASVRQVYEPRHNIQQSGLQRLQKRSKAQLLLTAVGKAREQYCRRITQSPACRHPAAGAVRYKHKGTGQGRSTQKARPGCIHKEDLQGVPEQLPSVWRRPVAKENSTHHSLMLKQHHISAHQYQVQHAMAEEEAQQVWSQVLLAGVMATFGRCVEFTGCIWSFLYIRQC